MIGAAWFSVLEWLGAVSFLGLLAAASGWAGSLIGLSTVGERRRIYADAPTPRQRWMELSSAPAILLFDASVMALAIRYRWVRWVLDAPVGLTIATLVAMYLWFELWFWVTHRLMHTRALFFIHAHHHVSSVTNPLTSLSFSLSERAIYQLGVVLGLAGLSRLLPVPAASALGFLALTYFLTVHDHLNVELVPPWVVRSPLGWVVGTSSFHAMHHARGTGHYSFTTPVLDYVFHTVWDDYPDVHARAAAGLSNPR